MKIKLSELKNMFDILITKAQDSGFEEIDIDFDNYWFISSDERINFSSDVPVACVGSLIDDIESINNVLIGMNIPTPVDFDRLANVLIAVGEKISSSNKVY